MSIYIWGLGKNGQLGLGHDKRDHFEPTLLDTHTDDKLEWIQIECGLCHTVGLTKNGEVFTWGDNPYGQLGHGDNQSRIVPTKVKKPHRSLFTKISCGRYHTVALTQKGEIFTWGWDKWGQLGHNHDCDQRREPRKVEAIADQVIVDVVCGSSHTCAIASTGSIFTWGDVTLTGHGEGNEHILKPRLLQDLSFKGIVSMSANFSHTACVTKAGEVFTWGYGDFGMLGHGDETDQHIPKRVEALVGIKVKNVSCGCTHTAVCTEDEHVYTFGYGKYGELGHGDKEDKTSPSLVQALVGKHITQVQCGCNDTMALTSSGYVFSWGYNFDCFIPCLVEELRDHNVVQMSCGSAHCAVLVDPTSPSLIRQSQQASFNNQELSDVVFKVEHESLYANIDVLTQKSDYFAAMFRSNMRERIDRVVNVQNCTKTAFLRVLEYFYLDGFTVSIDDAVKLWVLADMYQMEGLKWPCMSAFERGLNDGNVSQILGEIEDLICPCEELKSICHEYLSAS